MSTTSLSGDNFPLRSPGEHREVAARVEADEGAEHGAWGRRALLLVHRREYNRHEELNEVLNEVLNDLGGTGPLLVHHREYNRKEVLNEVLNGLGETCPLRAMGFQEGGKALRTYTQNI